MEEITAPDGYLISEEEFPFVVEKDGAVKVEEDSDGDPVIEVVIEDTPVKGSISITKAGEVVRDICLIETHRFTEIITKASCRLSAAH